MLLFFACKEVAFGVRGFYFPLSTVTAKFVLYLSLSACFSTRNPVHPFVEPSGLLFSCLICLIWSSAKHMNIHDSVKQDFY